MVAQRIEADDQLGMDEQVIDSPDLEQALEEHQLAKDAASAARLLAKNAKAKVVSLIEGLALDNPTGEKVPTVARIARFRITKKFVKGKLVSFTTEDRVQLSFGLADQPDDQDEPADDDVAAENAVVARLDSEQAFKPHLLPVDGQASEQD